MTGFGRAEGDTGLGRLLVESRSVNHRFCDINIKLPKRLQPLETRLKEVVRSQVSRGRVDISIKLDSFDEERGGLIVDFHLAEQYYQALLSIKERFKLNGEITLELIAGAKDLITTKEEPLDIEPYWQEILFVLKRAVQDMDSMKRIEGESISRDLKERVERIKKELEEIKNQFPSRFESYRERLKERIRNILNEEEIDSIRFQQEVAFLAEKTDITEEIVRVESHLAQFSMLFDEEEPVGRKMDFLIQEIYREVNTISNKANDAEISQRVVEIKSELEKIREQVQNIE